MRIRDLRTCRSFFAEALSVLVAVVLISGCQPTVVKDTDSESGMPFQISIDPDRYNTLDEFIEGIQAVNRNVYAFDEGNIFAATYYRRQISSMTVSATLERICRKAKGPEGRPERGDNLRSATSVRSHYGGGQMIDFQSDVDRAKQLLELAIKKKLTSPGSERGIKRDYICYRYAEGSKSDYSPETRVKPLFVAFDRCEEGQQDRCYWTFIRAPLLAARLK